MYNLNPNKKVESFAETISRQEQKHLFEAWSKNINSVKSVDPNFSVDSQLRLAQVLENTQRALDSISRKYEGTQVPDIGPFRYHVFDIITAMYPTQIADELVSVQTLTQKMGQVFFLKYLYGNSKGTITAGDDMISWKTGAHAYSNYDSETVEAEPYIDNASGTTDLAGYLTYLPVRPGTVVFTDGTNKYSDKGDGKLYNAGGTQVGTINYETGAVTGTITKATEVTVDYEYSLEFAPTNSGEVTVKVDEEIIKARPHKLRALYAFDAGYDLEMAQGIKIDEAILEACTAELRHERDGNVIKDLLVKAGNTSTWNRTIPTALTQKEHYESFIAELFFCASRIFQDTKRAYGNWVVVGKQGMDILTAVGAPRFVGAAVNNPTGPFYAGLLDGRMKVFCNPFMEEDEYLVGYKGNLYVDAGYILGDYLPVFASQLVMLDDFVGRRGFCSMYGTKLVNNKMYVKGKITNL